MVRLGTEQDIRPNLGNNSVSMGFVPALCTPKISIPKCRSVASIFNGFEDNDAISQCHLQYDLKKFFNEVPLVSSYFLQRYPGYS